MKTISIVPAMIIYTTNVWLSIEAVNECLFVALDAHEDADNIQDKVQAWETIKGNIQILKDSDAWDYEHGIPLTFAKEECK